MDFITYLILRLRCVFMENIFGTILENAKMLQHHNFRLHHIGEVNSSYPHGVLNSKQVVHITCMLKTKGWHMLTFPRSFYVYLACSNRFYHMEYIMAAHCNCLNDFFYSSLPVLLRLLVTSSAIFA